MKILIVDDDTGVAKAVKFALVSILKGSNLLVCAFTFKQAQMEIEDGAPDLLVTDFAIGNSYGTDLVPLLREGNPDYKVILMSGNAPQAREAAQKVGITHLLAKPFTLKELSGVLRDIGILEKESAHV